MNIYYKIIYVQKSRVIGRAIVKYNELNRYEKFLLKNYTPATAATYKKAVDFLLHDQYFLDCRTLDTDKVIQKLIAIKYKNQYSKYKNAFLKFCDFQGIEIQKNVLLELELIKTDKIKKRRKLKQIALKDIQNHIKVIQDKKLKLSFEMMLNTGLRVSELTQIKKEDCLVSKNSIEFSFIAKGGNIEKITFPFSQNERLFNNLTSLIENTHTGKIFYSTNYIQTKANEKGFHCHDLRRAFAKLDYKKNKNLEHTRVALRHTNVKNTKIYVNSKIKI